jgi:hypothetical protein
LAARQWGKEHASLLLRLYAFGLFIQAERRNDLIAIAGDLLEEFGENHDGKWLAGQIVRLASNSNEMRFLLHAFDQLMKRLLRASYRNRAVIVTRVRYLCHEIARTAIQPNEQTSERFRGLQ